MAARYRAAQAMVFAVNCTQSGSCRLSFRMFHARCATDSSHSSFVVSLSPSPYLDEKENIAVGVVRDTVEVISEYRENELLRFQK